MFIMWSIGSLFIIIGPVLSKSRVPHTVKDQDIPYLIMLCAEDLRLLLLAVGIMDLKTKTVDIMKTLELSAVGIFYVHQIIQVYSTHCL